MRFGTAKKRMSIFLALLLMGAAIAPLASYAEEPSNWALTEVQQAEGGGLIPDNLSLGYKANTNRLEFCHLVMNMIQVKTGMTISEFMEFKGVVIEPLTFTDTNDTLILSANALDIVNGVGNNKFDPNGQLQRQQAAAMLARAARVLGYSTASDLPIVFSDSSTFQVYAVEPIAFVSAAKDMASGKNVMGGMGNNMFGPAAPFTKEQAILTMLRLYNAFEFDSVPRVLGVESIEGTPMQGHKLSAGEVVYDSIPLENPVLSWQWVSSSTENGTYNPITGATNRDYTPDASDVGKYINVIVAAEGGARGSGLSFPVLIERYQLIQN